MPQAGEETLRGQRSENARHAGLIALFLFNFWNATGLLPIAQAMVIFGSSLDDEEG